MQNLHAPKKQVIPGCWFIFKVDVTQERTPREKSERRATPQGVADTDLER